MRDMRGGHRPGLHLQAYKRKHMAKPLAERMRPNSLDDYVGQEQLVGPEGVLRKALEKGHIPSFILWGPPGTGKTTLATIIAHQLKRPFISLNAVHSGVKDIREAIQKAKGQQFFDRPSPILFIDEIHRFSKSQQDALLHAVEKGTITLIGATTENPSFEVISPLLSRCQVYVLEPLNKTDLETLARRALERDEQLRKFEPMLRETDALLHLSGGDARKLYNLLELSAEQCAEGEQLVITNQSISRLADRYISRYDKGGEQHYDLASAFIKSIRGSDPNAAIYWLARMLEGGEDVKFIARRLIISAAEDIGLANPNALLLATETFRAVQTTGMPEARIILAEATIYLASSPKSNSAYLAIDRALEAVRQGENPPVPLSLRNAPTKLMKELGYGQGYPYAHEYEGHFVQTDFLPETWKGHVFYQPADNPQENKIRERLKKWWDAWYKY